MGDHVLPYDMTVYQAVQQFGGFSGHSGIVMDTTGGDLLGLDADRCGHVDSRLFTQRKKIRFCRVSSLCLLADLQEFRPNAFLRASTYHYTRKHVIKSHEELVEVSIISLFVVFKGYHQVLANTYNE